MNREGWSLGDVIFGILQRCETSEDSYMAMCNCTVLTLGIPDLCDINYLLRHEGVLSSFEAVNEEHRMEVLTDKMISKMEVNGSIHTVLIDIFKTYVYDVTNKKGITSKFWTLR